MAIHRRATKVPAPLSIAPSQAFEGNDGPWSTFALRVGTPEQVFHVLISTLSQETWVVLPEGCTTSDPSNCGALRGVQPFESQPSSGFQTNASTTWQGVGLYALSLEDPLGYAANGSYGFDTVGLELPGSGGPSLKHQVVGGLAAKDFYLGEFGLGPKPTNFTDFDQIQPSFMASLKNQSMIPSLSWGYTAGAQYHLKGMPGSLTLGGYDASRFTPNGYNFTFDQDDSKSLTVGLQSIQASNTLHGLMSLLETGVLVLIDSTIPEIWLPTSNCAIFEQAFGLVYDPNTDRYLVNDTTHATLTKNNPTLDFRIGNTATGVDGIHISLPYAAFDLVADYPIYPNATRYFPLRRGNDSTGYILGRAFLQEAYVIADYERSNFSVSQCVFDDSSPETIIAIRSPSSIKDNGKSGLSTGALAGIVVAVVLLLVIVTGLIGFFCIRKKRKTGQDAEEAAAKTLPADIKDEDNDEQLKSPIPENTFEAGGEAKAGEMYSERERQELHTEEGHQELETDSPRQEMYAGEHRPELMGADGDMRHESGAREVMAELPAAPYSRH